MGWIAYHEDGTITQETHDARPIAEGKKGKLRMIVQEDYGHKVAVDLKNGVIIIDYDTIAIQNDTIEINDAQTILYVCDETNIVGDLEKIKISTPDEEGWFTNTRSRFVWRPIWFTRHSNVAPMIKVIGLQTTLVPPYGRKNIKKIVSLFGDGRIGIS